MEPHEVNRLYVDLLARTQRGERLVFLTGLADQDIKQLYDLAFYERNNPNDPQMNLRLGSERPRPKEKVAELFEDLKAIVVGRGLLYIKKNEY
jgi:hypothetical protein